MTWITYLGLFAAVCTTYALFPQVLKTTRTKKTGDLSFSTYLFSTIGIFCWLIYGILINELPIIVANTISLLFAGWILGLKIRYR